MGRSINRTTFVLRVYYTGHKSLMAVSLSEARQVMMVKMAGDLNGLLDDEDMMGKLSKDDLMA